MSRSTVDGLGCTLNNFEIDVLETVVDRATFNKHDNCLPISKRGAPILDQPTKRTGV